MTGYLMGAGFLFMPINWTDVIIKIIVTAPAIIFAFAAWRTSKKVNKNVNGRMDEFKKLLKENADLQRKIEGRTRERFDDTN